MVSEGRLDDFDDEHPGIMIIGKPAPKLVLPEDCRIIIDDSVARPATGFLAVARMIGYLSEMDGFDVGLLPKVKPVRCSWIECHECGTRSGTMYKIGGGRYACWEHRGDKDE